MECSKEIKKCITELKSKILNFHLAAQGNKCCYCKTSLIGNVSFLADIEHILPKGKFRDLTYEIWNLSASCKRYNMSYKGEKTDFIEDIATIRDDLHNPNRYKFVHPNYDCWDEHLKRTGYSNNGMELLVIPSRTPKGEYTKEFVNLFELEVDTFDKAQGATEVDPIVVSIRALFPNQS